VATLVLLNGPPASGKSTLAARLVEGRSLALNLDIDVVRGLLGAWIDRPADAGLAARALAVSMARTHLTAGHPRTARTGDRAGLVADVTNVTSERG
jgi:predicted kinase